MIIVLYGFRKLVSFYCFSELEKDESMYKPYLHRRGRWRFTSGFGRYGSKVWEWEFAIVIFESVLDFT